MNKFIQDASLYGKHEKTGELTVHWKRKQLEKMPVKLLGFLVCSFRFQNGMTASIRKWFFTELLAVLKKRKTKNISSSCSHFTILINTTTSFFSWCWINIRKIMFELSVTYSSVSMRNVKNLLIGFFSSFSLKLDPTCFLYIDNQYR